MLFGGGTQFGLLEVILLIIPGLAGVKVWFYIMNQSDHFNRIDTIGLSVAISLSMILALYMGHSWSEYGRNTILPSAYLTNAEIESILTHFPTLTAHYIAITTVSLLTGIIVGSSLKWLSGPLWSQNRIWEHYFSDVNEDEFQLRVVTTDGTKIEGRIDKYGESTAKRDLMLKKPRTVEIKTDSGEEPSVTEIESWTGSVYIHNQDVSYVIIDELIDADGPGEDEEPDYDDEEAEEQRSSVKPPEENEGSEQSNLAGSEESGKDGGSDSVPDQSVAYDETETTDGATDEKPQT